MNLGATNNMLYVLYSFFNEVVIKDTAQFLWCFVKALSAKHPKASEIIYATSDATIAGEIACRYFPGDIYC